MRKYYSCYWIFLFLYFTDINGNPLEEENRQNENSVNLDITTDSNNVEINNRTRHFECPIGFFRIRKICYYLSAGTAKWRDAHFQCMARNSTLVVLNKYGKDKLLRKYLQDDKFEKLERWIGGIFNWVTMKWEWATDQKFEYQNFLNPESATSKHSAYHCILMDPNQGYKWNTSNCVSPKYYICEVPATRVNKSRQRKNISDPFAPQNQRLRAPSKKDKNKIRNNKTNNEEITSSTNRKNKLKAMRKKNWQRYDDNFVWSHGIKPGSIPPKDFLRQGKRQRHNNENRKKTRGNRRKHHREQQTRQSTENPQVTQITKEDNIKEKTFPGDGRLMMPSENANRLDINQDFHSFFGNNGEFTHEEILLKI